METLHPGIYTQEVEKTPPMQGVSTSVGAFVGTAIKGKVGVAEFITNFSQFEKEYGGFSENSHLAYAVKGFFDNGGKNCYISRVVHYDRDTKTSAEAVLDLNDSEHEPKVTITVKAKSDGTWGNKIAVEVKKEERDDDDVQSFTLHVYYNEKKEETYEGLTLENAEAEVMESNLIRLVVTGENIPADISKTNLSKGKDGLEGITDADYLGSQEKNTGLYAFDKAKINLVAIPAITSVAVLQGLIAYAEGREDCMAILDVPKGNLPAQVKTFIKDTASLSTGYGACYYPWIKVNDPIGVGKKPIKIVAPSGHIMGQFASTDAREGCWVAPSGTKTKLKGVVGLEYEVSDTEQDILNPVGINCIRKFEGDGIVIWGTRTLAQGDYKYIPVRRLSIFIKQSLRANLRWAVFRPNSSGSLWTPVTLTVENFLNGIWAQGGLKGSSSSEAYSIVCDESNNDADSIDSGKVNIDIGLSVLKPAEFVIFRLSLKK